ncbi:MAG: efflux RND transporter periplasmic adaptor subunit, partial [Deltaproteobacteria bacterium]|nr:efflux RND transporter periplasmic adaptor subunit [Deltaproteobacteria bacterium]
MKKKLFFWIVVILLLAAAAFGYVYFYLGKDRAVRYRTAKVERGSISAYVTANGTVNPVIMVLVGSQVSGSIQKLYADYNTRVKKGDLVAQIDPAVFQAQVSQAKAKVENARAAALTAQADISTARANVESSKANVLKAQVAVDDAKRNLGRSLELFQRNLISASDRDTAQTNYDSAVALLEAARAQQKASDAQLESAITRLEAARAQIKQAEAELELAQVNLDHCRITAPVTGIVISRNVDVGQTVAASLQAPTLFTIAQDLMEMQVDTSMSEADVGRLAIGQDATFTVDAFPQTTFRGKVTEIRNAPVTVQNVVTYDVVIQVKNSELKLRPGMTANASILVAHKDDVLRIPNAALRFRPDFAKKEASPQKGAQAASTVPAPTPSLPSLDRLKAELNLTPAQQTNIAHILADMKNELQGTRKVSPEGASEKTRQLSAFARSKISAVLTEEQRKKFEQMPEQTETRTILPKFKVWVPVPQKMPMSVEITTGISDGSYTEALSG